MIIKTIFRAILALILLGIVHSSKAQTTQDRPNILWLCIEDMSVDYLPAYGVNTIETPNLDRLVDGGIVFDNAYSNGTQCSPARTTLISGVYSTSLGAEVHRMDTRYPESLYWTKQYLEANGYWTTNFGKTDYNVKNEDDVLSSIWTRRRGTFENAPANRPFFCFDNNFDTHMSKITDTRDIARQRTNRTVALEDVDVPAYLPDVRLIRDDLAWYYETIKNMDDWLGEKLDALEESGRADNTIIFFFADNGGSASGSKGFLRQDGMKIPMVAYFPERWRHLEPASRRGRNNELVEFVDFPPTMLQLAGITPPEYMQGRNFCGTDPDPEQDYAYGIRCNQGDYYIPSRALTDGEFKFIWHYNTFFSKGSRKSFQFYMPGFRAWERQYRNGNLSGVQADFWEPMPTFELYDLTNDPQELVNLANDDRYSAKLDEMKEAVKQKIRDTKDLGFNPRSLRDTTSTSSYYEIVNDGDINLENIYKAAELASQCRPANRQRLRRNLRSSNPTVRYWGAVGFARLAYHGMISALPDEVYDMIDKRGEALETRLTCAFAMASVGDHCNAFKIFDYHAPSSFASSYMAVLKDPTPYTQLIYDSYLASPSNFSHRSALINAGVMRYSDLVDPSSNPNLNLDLLSNSDVLDECVTYYHIRSRTKGLLMRPASMEDDSEMIYVDRSTDNDWVLWERIDFDNGVFQLRNKMTRKVVRTSGNETGDGLSQKRPTPNDGNWTKWFLRDASNGYSHIVNNGVQLHIALQSDDDSETALIVKSTSSTGAWTQWMLEEYTDESSARQISSDIESNLSTDTSQLLVYPNPSDGLLHIGFELSQEERVGMKILDQTGRVVKELVGDKVLGAGEHALTWQPIEEGYSSGFYILVFNAGGHKETRSLIVK